MNRIFVSQPFSYLHEAIVDEPNSRLEDDDIDDVEQVGEVVDHPPVDAVVVRLVARVAPHTARRHHRAVAVHGGPATEGVVLAQREGQQPLWAASEQMVSRIFSICLLVTYILEHSFEKSVCL